MASEEMLKAILNAADESILLIAPGGIVLSLNDTAAQRLKVEKADLVGKNVYGILPPETAALRRAKIESVYATGQAVNYDDERDGRFYSHTVYPVKDDTGKVVAAASYSHDITDRKKAMEILRRSEERYRILAETMLQGVVHQDADGRILSMNPAAKRILGKSYEAFFKDGSLDGQDGSIHEDGSPFPCLEHPTRVALRTGRIVRGVVTGVYDPQRDKYRWIKIDAIPVLRNNDAGAQEVYTVFEDITRRKQMEETLRANEERFRSVLNNSLDIIFRYNLKTGKYEYWSPACGKLLGYEPDELMAMSHEEMLAGVHTDDLPALQAGIKRTLTAGEGLAEYRFRDKRGNYRWWSTKMVIIKDKFGQPLCRDGFMRDITAQKKADEEKNNFIAIMSHELRNPLTPILSGMQYVRAVLKKTGLKKEMDPLLVDSLRIVEQQAKNMGRLLDDLLDISRISRGQIILKKRSVNLSDSIRHAVKSVQPLINTQKHGLVVVLPEAPLFLDADPVRLEQIMVNLLNNAIKYTPPGGKILISGRREGDEARITIKDNGIGIEKSRIATIFELFNRQTKPFISTQGELGIGLKLTKDLVALHNGTISAASPGKNQGSEFIISFPALPENHRLELPSGPAPAVSKKRRILIVDDNANIGKLFARMISLIGHDTRVCHDGISAINAAHDYRPHLALVDIGLPDMPGHDVARALRKIEKESKQNIRLVAVTGYGQYDDFRQSQDAGFDRHLVKPIELTTLEKTINELLS